MVSLLKVPLRMSVALFATGLLVAASRGVGRPGTVNYVEGSVTLGNQTLGARQIGQTEVEPGQTLQTGQGKAEMLLTPGVLIRIGDNSAVKMVSPGLADTRVELLRGEAMVEAQQVSKDNHIAITDGGFDTLIEKKGIYEFNADRPMVSVYDGKVKVMGDDRHEIEFGKGKELALGVDSKPHKFDRDQTDSLYAWSKLRSGYMAEANEAAVQNVIVGGPGWYGSGWYWSPWYNSYAFVPADGYLMSPFGFGFYSPSYWYSMGPFYSYGYPYRVYRGVRPGRVWSAPPASSLQRPGGIRGFGMPAGRAPAGRAPAGGGAARSLGRGARM